MFYLFSGLKNLIKGHHLVDPLLNKKIAYLEQNWHYFETRKIQICIHVKVVAAINQLSKVTNVKQLIKPKNQLEI